MYNSLFSKIVPFMR